MCRTYILSTVGSSATLGDMDIYYLGDASFKLSGRDTTLLSFPNAKNKADIVIGSPKLVTDVHKAVEGPGEYEVRGISIFGYLFGYLVEMDDIRVLLVSDSSKTPTDDEITHVGEVDVLLVPADEHIDTFIRKFGPSATVPFGLGTATFIEKAGVSPEPITKLSMKPGTFLPDESKIVLLSQK